MTPAVGILYRFYRAKTETPWWEIEDKGGFPPWWTYGLQGRIKNDRIPWPSDWDRRPHP